MSANTQTAHGSGSSNVKTGYLLATPATAIVALIVLVPALQLVRYSLNHFDPVDLMQTALTTENYRRFFTDPYYQSVLWSTLKISILCTVLSLVLGFPVAYSLAKSQSKRKSLLIILIVFPLLVGSVVRAAGWMVILGNAGFVNALLIHFGIVSSPIRLMYTPLAVVLGTTGVVLPYMILTLQSVLEGIDLSVEEAARNLGASPAVSFFRIVLPMATPGIAAGTMLVLILCMNAYATPVLLGGTGLTMMAPTVYEQISKASNWPFGSALALILMVVTLGTAVLSNLVIQRNHVKTMQS
ncbi:TPA: ABC transporter permease [Burkholderia cepacia]|uniref:ABC transporter permease n=4 Tax=Burkholderia cepacia complex TaxID=87882 RepID=A0A1V2VXG5_9BURK|nr:MULTISPECIES: ABC transporter permease [Burkholderia cepacia complex]HDR9758532.1 ABC transporter permease [Burkholderia cepacia ATCC 25416]AOR68654.1 ABC transporter permease [Burkholderia stabilis]MBR8292367.1 ABC transporter permease [Burkholderia cenocepacia]MCA8363607.1 ABC transporter permease [Burkholderia cepacia]ONJ11762.1 ABC transporter permease [Burkholderia cenocepacia]